MYRTLFFLFFTVPVLSGEVMVTLADVPARVAQHHPALRAARLTVDEARGRLLGAGRLTSPEAGLEFKHDDRYREGVIGLSFDQKFPLTSRLRLQKELSAKEVIAAELEVLDQQRLLVAQARVLSTKLLALEQQRLLRQKQAALAQKLAAFAVKRAEAGEMSALDAAQAQIDAQRTLLDGRVLETERIALTGELKPLLGIAAAQGLKLSGELPKAALPGAASDWNGRADYRLSKLREEAAGTGINLAKAGKWEDVSAGVFLEGERMEDAPEGLQRTTFIGFRISLPLPLWNKNEGKVHERTAAAKRATLETQALAQRIESEIAAAHADMEAQFKLASETKDKLLPLVLQQTERLEKAYDQGQADLLTVLRAREQRLQLETAVLTATREFHLARVRYEAANGVPR